MVSAAWIPAAFAQDTEARLTLTEADCGSAALAEAISPSEIGEPVSAVVLDSLTWMAASGNTPAHCMVNGRLEPVDQSDTARPIRFGVALPAEWNRRSIQMGGGGMNGSIPGLAGGFGGGPGLATGFATYGSDSGHANGDSQWTLNDEAIRNLGYMQMKKTHDVAMVLIERAYDLLPAYNYYVGSSQGGREALTVAQRYPEDYDGVMSSVPIVGFSSLMLGPTRLRIQERALENWVTPAKGTAILAEFMRRCDSLDARVDGIINNYYDCRALFNVNDDLGEDDPWAAKRCASDVDPNPADTSAAACLTSGQIETLEFQFSSVFSGEKLANGREHFGMWAPSTAVGGGGGFGAPPGGRGAAAPGAGRGATGPGGRAAGAGAPGGRAGGPPGGGGAPGGLFTGTRYRGQEGAAADAPVFATLGTDGVTGFMMQDVGGNPLDFSVAQHGERHEQVSEWLDSTDPDLRDFRAEGGKLIVAVGTDDTIAPSGEQLDYYQSMLDEMGRDRVDSFARLYVLPQTGHGLTGRSASIDGNGQTIESTAIPSTIDRFALLQNWVENGVAPGKSETVTGGDRSLPLCSYPEYPRYVSGDAALAASYRCTEPVSAQ
jgi:feruloyl esterase